MKMNLLIEGTVLFGIGLIGFIETFHLGEKIDPSTITDVLGPGNYILCLSILLMMTAILHVSVNYRNILRVKKMPLKTKMGTRRINMTVFYMIVVFAIYLALIYVIGYLASTLIFFFLEFRLAGVQSWKSNVVVTLIVAFVFHFLFIEYLHLEFPKGIFFR